ncbi:CAP domain-containing protein [Planosporangium mesophilum]|uniref:SCP domain-containing protein n=1 Tax=Planosporangium mesophilum TaxID=689768 RepID=A0A8J3T8H7_9ACTN|nr:CAP domain-containing protein [Planosporangium mesophilum]NJC81346.1 CAP domain-containing protein [Planosporangium mesophilum]GII21001.1 hypothetical protein Pme01_05980 [Planosporangium mesophilum]
MTRTIRRAAVSAALITAAFGATLTVSGAANAATVSPTTVENQISTLINSKRAAAGCGALRTDERLRTVARAHSADMATRNFFSHNGSDGSTFATRIKSVGYTRAYGENIAWGYRTATAVVDGWMNSAPHRANILNCAYNNVGVGVAYKADGTPYWTQDFGRS